nr:putative nuclease HARBI1 [Lytechinus pictus]
MFSPADKSNKAFWKFIKSRKQESTGIGSLQSGQKLISDRSVLDSSGTIHGVSRSTTCRVIHRVAGALCNIKHEIIKFPCSDDEVTDQQTNFYKIANFPKVVGAVDGTHVYLHGAPLGPDEHVYINRKGRYSINVQLICDYRFKITNCVARWPGSTHDSRILQNSIVGHEFIRGNLHGILLGDSGYALQPWIMTPFLNPTNRAERAFNRAHSSTRVLIEQVNGQLKNKFRCLIGHGLQMSPLNAKDIIMACAVLHNLSKDLNQPEVPFQLVDNDEDEIPDLPDGVNGPATRAQIVASFFQ